MQTSTWIPVLVAVSGLCASAQVRCGRSSPTSDPRYMERVEQQIRGSYSGSGSGGQQGSPNGTVSVRELGVPRKANHELLLGQKAFQKSDYSAAEKHLRKALNIYPAYAAAHNDLGVIYEKQKQYRDAAGEFRKAV